MDGIFLKCMKRGNCCRNLLEEREGVLKGLTLTANETSLFPSNMVSPLTATGRKRPEHIIDYQLNVNNCPHIDEANQCRIYDKRPLVCRAFPYVQRGFSMKCPVLKGVFKKEGLPVVFPVPPAEREADQKRDRYFQNRLRKYSKTDSKTWLFNLATRQWIERA